MRRLLCADHDQLLLLTPSVEDWVGADHPARFVREFVHALDLTALGLDTLKREEGGVAHDPRVLLSAWLYGYLRKVRSTRALERACREEMGFVWLTGNHRPDHHALWRFWNTHREGVRALFRQSVRVAIELKLVGMVVQALDGTKIQAACGGRGGHDREHLEKLLARLDAELNEREAQIARASEGVGAGAGLPAELQSTRKLREQVHAALARVRAGEARHVHPKEPDATRMQCDGRNRFGYNAQAMVDTHAQIVVASDVIAAPDDQTQLTPMIAQARAVREPAPANPTTLADGGYANGAQLGAATAAGHDVLTPLPSAWRDTSDPYHAAHFRHDAARRVVICPQGKELPLQRVREKNGRPVEVYRDTRACRDCPVRADCTRDRQGRGIDIAPGHAELVALRQRWLKPATAEFYGLRAPTVEPVFAQIKQQMGFRRWTVRTLEKVRAQWALLCTTWNLQVIYRHWRGGRSGGDGPKITPDTPTGPRRPVASPPARPRRPGSVRRARQSRATWWLDVAFA